MNSKTKRKLREYLLAQSTATLLLVKIIPTANREELDSIVDASRSLTQATTDLCDAIDSDETIVEVS